LLSGWGANVATTAPAAFTCASLAMSCPPMRLKLPPTNHPAAPSDTIALTPPPSIFGKASGAVGSPCASSATAELTHGVTLANDPPRYRLSPVRSTALTVPSTLTDSSGVGDSAAEALGAEKVAATTETKTRTRVVARISGTYSSGCPHRRIADPAAARP
jgi:hypothetical protein